MRQKKKVDKVNRFRIQSVGLANRRGEIHNRLSSIWSETASDKVYKRPYWRTLTEFNPIYMMATSGARGSIGPD